MDILLKTENNLEYYLISHDSGWWEKLVENGNISNLDYVPPLTERMPMEAIFNRFKNENSFTIVAGFNNTFAGCFCCYLRHPIRHRPAVQFILIAEQFRDKKITNVLFNLAFKKFIEHGHFLIETGTWSTNYRSQRVFARCGFYLNTILENDRGEGVHSLIYKKNIFRSGYFTDLISLQIVCGGNLPLVSKYADEIMLLTKHSGGAWGLLPIEVLDADFEQMQMDLLTDSDAGKFELSVQTKPDGPGIISIPNPAEISVTESGEYSVPRKSIKLIDYVIDLSEQKQGMYLLLCNAKSITPCAMVPDTIILPDNESQVEIDAILNRIRSGETTGNIIAEIASIILGYPAAGVIIACIEFYQITDEIERLLADREVINVFQMLKYDIADSWRETKMEVELAVPYL